MKTGIYISLFLTILFAVSCNKRSQPKNFDYGSYENGKYTNSFFDLELSLPVDWHVLSQEENANLMNNSSDFISEENKTLQKAVETSKVTTVILLTASQYGFEASDTVFNPNMMLLAENLEGTDKVKSASDYLLVTRNALQQDPTLKEFPFAAFQLKNIHGVDFSQMKVIYKVPQTLHYTQDYYVSLQRGFALSVILTYNSELQKQALEQILNSLKISEE